MTDDRQAMRKAIGAELKRQRIALGFGQAATAHRAGITNVHLCRIESGASGLSVATLLALVAALGGDQGLLGRVAERLREGGAPDRITTLVAIADHLDRGCTMADQQYAGQLRQILADEQFKEPTP